MDVYFCGAYKPWQRGHDENANGIIRCYLAKGIDLSPFADKNLANLLLVLNNIPRPILDFKTPREILSRLRIDHSTGVALQAGIGPPGTLGTDHNRETAFTICTFQEFWSRMYLVHSTAAYAITRALYGMIKLGPFPTLQCSHSP